MRAFTCGMKVVEELLRTRICVLVVLIFVCSSLSDAATESMSRVPSSRSPGNLTNEQRKSVVTIEFSFKNIDPEIRAAAIREIHRKILEYLNRKNSTTVPPTYTTATVFSTTAYVAMTTTPPATTSTTSTPTSPIPTGPIRPITTSIPTGPVTTASIPTGPVTTTSIPTSPITTTCIPTGPITTTSIPTGPITTTSIPTGPITTTSTPTGPITTTSTPTGPITTTSTPTSPITTTRKTTTIGSSPTPAKRRRRQISDEDINFTDEDLLLLKYDPEINGNGTLTISLFIDKEGLDAIDLDDILYNAAKQLNLTGELGLAANNESVIKIYKGLPPPLSPTSSSSPSPPLPTMKITGYQVWLPILLAIVLLLIIFIFICCWKATNKKAKKDEREKIIPKEDTMNGHKPRILDDGTGWLVPYEHFNCEQ